MIALPMRRTLVLGFGFLGINIIWPIFNQFVPIFLQAGNPEFARLLSDEGRAVPQVSGFGLAPSLALFIMTWDNLINMFVQPWVGARSDRTWNRFGRRKPWILIGAPVAVMGFVFLPLAQSMLVFIACILVTNFGMALFRAPTVAWLGDLFPAHARSRANGVINFMGGVGGLLAFFGGGLLFASAGRNAPFAAGAIAMTVALTAALIFVRENPSTVCAGPAEHTGAFGHLKSILGDRDKRTLTLLIAIVCWSMAFSALETALSSFAVFGLGMAPGTASIYTGLVTVSFIAFAIPAGLLGERLGRRRTIRLGLVGFAAVTAVSFVVVTNRYALAAALILIGACWALINVNSLPWIYDHSDSANFGAHTGAYYLATQFAAVLGPTLCGAMIQLLGNQYRWVWLFAAIFLCVALFVLSNCPYTSSRTHSRFPCEQDSQ